MTDFTLKVQPGETIALVGPTGGNKAPLWIYFAVFMNPGKARSASMGVTIPEYTMGRSHSALASCTKHRIFSGTVRENIRYGKLEARCGCGRSREDRRGA
ncbi:MAG: hypothetical protein IPJ47_10620 [Anaerolineales bacterium]|nr:hypothetical protein [Anaerolineales bacterium]